MKTVREYTQQLIAILPLRWLFLLGTLLFLLISGGLWFYNSQEQQLRQEVEANLTGIAQLKADQIVAWRETQLSDATFLANSPLFRRELVHFLSTPHTEPDSDFVDLLNLIKAGNQYTAVLLVNQDGEIILGTDRADELPDDLDSVLDTAVRENQAFFIDLHHHLDAEPDNIHITAVVPVYEEQEPQGEPLGLLLLVTDTEELLFPLINSWPVPSESAETLLIRQDGEQVLFLNNLRHLPSTALSLRLPLSQTDLPAVMAINGQTGFVRGYDYRDVEVAAVLLPVPDSPWFMVSKIDADEAFVAWQIRSWLILATVLGLIAVIAGFSLYFLQRSRKFHYQALYMAEAEMLMTTRRHDITLNSIGDGVIVTDAQGDVELLNPVAEALTGWDNKAAKGKPLTEIFPILNEETGTAVANPVQRVLQDGKIQRLANHTILVTRDGEERPIADRAAPIFDEAGAVNGAVLIFRDQTDARLRQRLTDLRIKMDSFASGYSLSEFLTFTLDEVGELVSSPIGFYHFVAPDQQSLSLQQWSTRTAREFCTVKADEWHYSVDKAGVWADCLRQKRAIIHNDYPGLENKNGMPPGHADLQRELVVPVMRGDQIVSILGVGNKPTPYTDRDLEVVSVIADHSWQLVEKMQAEARLRENQKMLATAEEVAGMGSWKWDLVTKKLTWSTGMFRLFGVSPEEFDGDVDRVIADRIHPEDKDALQEANNLALKEGKPTPRSFRILMPDKSIRFVWTDGTIVKDENGEPIALTGYVQNVTQKYKADKERERLHSRIHQQAQQMQKVMDAAPEGIILLDDQYRLIQANTAARQALNVLSLKGYKDTLVQLGNSPLETLLTSPPDGLWHQVVAKNRIFEVNARQLEHAPNFVGWVLVLRETTKQREFEEQLHRQERLASVGKLAAGIAHDFNNLLAVIILHSQLLKRKLDLGAKEKDQLDIIATQANRASHLIQQILDFSRRSAMTKTPLELGVVLKEEVDLLKRALPENIEIELVADSEEYLVHGDLTRLQQVIMNLAINARDAMPEGGRLQLKLGTYLVKNIKNAPLPEMKPGHWIHLSISDNGAGIEPGIIGQIFDPFFTTKEQGEGTGLGLAQVHGIVAQHGGFIDVSSEIGLGTTFEIYLPQLAMDVRFSTEKQVGDFYYGSGQRVLIVEDETALREVLAEVIGQWHYEVLQAGDGKEALRRLTEIDAGVDLIISDLVMPRMGGVAFVKALREQGWETPVLIMSGHPLDSEKELSNLSGVAQILSKPLHPAELNEAISKIFGG